MGFDRRSLNNSGLSSLRTGRPASIVSSPAFPRRAGSVASSTTSSITASRWTPLSDSNLSRASACATVRGNPSRMNPFAQSGCSIRSDNADHDIVGDQTARIHHGLWHFMPDRASAARNRCAQHIARRKLHYPILSTRRVRLCPLCRLLAVQAIRSSFTLSAPAFRLHRLPAASAFWIEALHTDGRPDGSVPVRPYPSSRSPRSGERSLRSRTARRQYEINISGSTHTIAR